MPHSPAVNTMRPALLVLILAMLLGIQPVTTDLYLPALPGLTRGFGATMAQAQLTLTALLLAFGLSQLIWGPLSDRFGRRPILLIGLAAYVLSAVASALATSMEQLIVWRTVQGAAMGASVMCARAVVRDLFPPAQGAHVMSKGLSGLGVIACISAPLGAVLTSLLDWHAALLALAVFGALTLALVAWRFEETLRHKNRHALQLSTLFSTWVTILRNPTFLAFSALSICSYSGLFTFLAASSFIFIRLLGFSTTAYGAVMLGMCVIYLGATFLCRRLLHRFGVRHTVAIGGVFSLTGGTLMGVLALAQVQSAWAIMLPHGLFTLGHGIHQSCGQSGAVGPFPQAAGAASAMNGFLMMLSAFVVGQWLGTHMDGTVHPLAYAEWFWSVLLALSAWTLVQKYGQS